MVNSTQDASEAMSSQGHNTGIWRARSPHGGAKQR